MSETAAEEWWSVDHHKSDRDTHVYCGVCYPQIPDFLIRCAVRIGQPGRPQADADGEPYACEGCDRRAAHPPVTRAVS